MVEIDFQSYFLTIPHGKLLRLIRQRVRDGSMLWLIKHSLKAGVLYQGQITPTTEGVPQGAPIAPLYSNIYLNLLDQVWHSRGIRPRSGPRCIAMPMMPSWSVAQCRAGAARV